jgi:hypothetical protein
MPRLRSLYLALLIGLLSAVICYVRLTWRAQMAADFTWPWRAAQFLIEGQNPYSAIQPVGEYPFQTYFYYPLPAALAALPFAWLPPYLAGALFFGLSSGLLAYAVSRDGWRRMTIFLSAPYWVALGVAQWSPLIVAATLLPCLGGLLLCKPNIGLAGFLYRPDLTNLVMMVVFGSFSLLVLPTWPIDWLTITRSLQGHYPPIFILPLGPLLILSIIRWRSPNGRLLLALSIFPQLLFFYDQLPLWLIPATLVESLVYCGLSWVAYLGWRWVGIDPTTGAILTQPTGFILGLIYLPALLMILLPAGYRRDLWGRLLLKSKHSFKSKRY